MKLWKFALIAVVVGFLHGLILQQSFLTTLQQVKTPVSQLADSIGQYSKAVAQQYVVAVADCARSEATTRIATLHPLESVASEAVPFNEPTRQPFHQEGTEKGQSEIPVIRIAGGLLSVDVDNMSLLRLLEDLGKKYDIDISSQRWFSDKTVSARLNDVPLEDGIRHLMRVSGVKNYALTYRDTLKGGHLVTQIILLPEENAISKDYYLAKAEQEPESDFPDHIQAGIWEDFKAEVRDEIPAKFRDGVLAGLPAEILAELRSGD